MIINGLVHSEVELHNKQFFIIKEINTIYDYLVPKTLFQNYPIEIGTLYKFYKYLDGSNKKYLLKFRNPIFEKYIIEETYPFIIKEFSTFINNKNEIVKSITIELELNIEKKVKAFDWHNALMWKHENIYCKVINFSKDGTPELIINDNRHPFYSPNEIYQFEIVTFKNKVSIKTNKPYNIILLKDNYECNYDVFALENQENKLIPGQIIDCKVDSIGLKLKLTQVNFNDPFFYTFEDILNDVNFKLKYFTSELSNEDDTNSLMLKNQYYSQSAFWVFTYCNYILPRLFIREIEVYNYVEAKEINLILIHFENWILSNGIINAFNNNIERNETKLKVELIINRLLTRDQVITNIISQDESLTIDNEFYSVPMLFEYISLKEFTSINEIYFVTLIENIENKPLNDNEIFTLNKLCDIIEYRKNYFLTELNDDYFIFYKSPNIDNSTLTKYLTWSYCQILIYKSIQQRVKQNLLLGRILRYFVYSTSNKLEKEILIFNAFYILVNNLIPHEIPIFRVNNNIKIDINKLMPNPNKLLNESSWDTIINKINEFNVNKVNIVEKHYKGYKIELLGVTGYLPIQNITDNNLKRNPFKNISWETNVEIHLYSREFNFFVAKQFELSSELFYSVNIPSSSKIGDIIQGKINNITNFGVFIITPLGDGLLHTSDISDDYWDKDWLEKYFKIGSTIHVKILDIENTKITLGFKQLIGTEYASVYYNFIFGLKNLVSDLYIGPGIDEENIDKEFELEKGFVFEQFALIQNDLDIKINYIKLAKQFFSNTQNARSYLHNIYIEYFNSINNLNKLIQNYSFEKYDEFRVKINLIKNNIDSKTIEIFSESENLIFFINILSLFNVNNADSDSELINYLNKYSNVNSKKMLSILTKTTLANNLLISEVKDLNNEEALNFSLKNLKRIRDYIENGVFSLAESVEDRLSNEINEKLIYWREKIKLDEGEKLEFKSSFITPIPDEDKLRIVANLEHQLDGIIDERSQTVIRNKIDEINGLNAQKAIIHSSLKSIAAFANTNGGYLLIGVSNDKKIFGLEKDYSKFIKGDEANRDGFGKFFDAKIKEYFGNSFSSINLEKEFLKFPEGDVLIVKIKQSAEEVFLLKDEFGNSVDHLYVRNLSSSEKLEGRELARFIRTKFRDQQFIKSV